MNNKLVWLRLAYWWGIVVDAMMAALMSYPPLFLRFVPVALSPDAGFTYGLISGVPLMVGWTLLLIWADRRPVERRDTLLLTVPVVVGYLLVELYGILVGLSTFVGMLPLFIAQLAAITLFIFGYSNAR